ncbi:MAG: choice-of-anchor D domain-containing protein [Chloroflexota bacterium]
MTKKLTGWMVGLLTLVLIASSISRADADLEKIKKNLPKLLGANNQGMEFALGFFPGWVEDRPPNGVGVPGIRVYISSGTKANVKVRVNSKDWEKNIQTIPNNIAEVFIPYNIAQVSAKSKDRDLPEPAQVWAGGAVMVTADAPIICYGLIRYPYTSDGYLAIPIASLGKEYVVAGYNGPSDDPDPAGQYLTSYTAIVGAYDKTRVTFTYGGRGNGRVETLEGKILTPGKSDTKVINKGDVWLIPARGHKPDITGSYVRADKPVACYSGNFCAYIPITKAACDVIIEQDMPMHVWGTKYYVTPIKDRLNNSPVRIFASQNNTTVFRNGWTDQVCTVPSKFGPENEGWIEVRAAEGVPQAVTMLSDKRFNVVQYNPGQQDDNIESDPFELAQTPIEQFQNQIVFNTPGIKGGLKFDVNYVNIVYQATESGQIPEDLEIGVFNSVGDLIWTPISMKFDGAPGYEFTDPTNPTPARKFYCKQLKLPEDGVYHVRAKDKFAAYAYGFSSYDSYGFPTSVATVDLERPDTVAPDVYYTIDCQGYVPDRALAAKKPAYVNDMPEEDSARSNMGVIYFDKDNSYNYLFEYDTFIPGEDRYVEWKLTPINPKLDARAVITFTDRAGNDTTVVIEHWATKLEITPRVKNFGKFKNGGTLTVPFKVTNKSAAAYVKLSNLRLLKQNQGFTLNYTFDPEIPLAPNDSRDFTITFNATAEGSFNDSVGVGDDCIFAYTGFVSAGVGTPRIEVSDVAFPKTTVNKQSNPITAVIKNTGNTELVITGYTGPSNAVFTTDLADLGITTDNPAFLAPNKELQFRVWFTPDAVKTYTDQVVFFNDANAIDSVCVITGEGIEPALTVTNENWLRKRVHLPKYDAAPFNFTPYPAPMGGIKLTNDGSQATSMKNVTVDAANSKNPEAFKVLKNGQYLNLVDNLADLNVSVPVGESRTFMVYFDPMVEGEHKLAINFESDAPTVTAILEGIGIYPRTITSDVDFKEVIIGAAPSRRVVRYTNENWGPYSDSLTITGFTTNPAGAVNTSYGTGNPGSEGFAYDLTNMMNDNNQLVNFPIVLQPGQYVDIPAEFYAQRYGVHSAEMVSISDAQADQTSKWTGFGITEALVPTPGLEPAICANTTATIQVSLANTGTRDISIAQDDLFVDADASNSFSITNVAIDNTPIASWQTGFTIPFGKKVDVTVTYAPISVSAPTHTANIVFKTNAIDPDLKTITIPVSGKSSHFSRVTRGVINGKPDIEVSPDKGSGITYSIIVDKGENMDLANVTEYNIKITHLRNFLDVRSDGGSLQIFKGAGLPADWQIVGVPTITVDDSKNEQTIDVKLRGTTKITTDNAYEVLRVELFAFLPWFKDSETGLPVQSKDIPTVISHVIDDNDQCVDYQSTIHPTAKLSEVCGDELRSIVVSSNQYSLAKIVPNPIDSRGGEIQFETAFDGDVQLNIFNSNNELVSTVVNGEIKAGKHSVRIPIELLSSGAYTYQIVAGPFRAAEPMIIVK